MIIEDFTMILPRDMALKDMVFVKSYERKHEHVHAWLNNLSRFDSLIYSKCYVFKNGKPRDHYCFTATTSIKNASSRLTEPMLFFIANEFFDILDIGIVFCKRKITLFTYLTEIVRSAYRCMFYKYFKVHNDLDEARIAIKKFVEHESKILAKFESESASEYKIIEFTTENKKQGQYGFLNKR